MFLRDFQHAARLYRDNGYALAPKNKFLYFVNFNLSYAARAFAKTLSEKYQTEINMLCKTVDLPQYSANVEVKNQYNRKKLIQTKIDYTPVRITMHDDNLGVTTLLLESYYKYYFKDGTNTGSDAYRTSNLYKNDDGKLYGLEAGIPSGYPFFENIKLYQLSRQQFTEFTLVNPMIERWGHDTMDQTDGAGIVENSLEINYEAVLYSKGSIDTDNPATFATRRYDVVDSPLGGREFANPAITDAWNSISAEEPSFARNTNPDVFNNGYGNDPQGEFGGTPTATIATPATTPNRNNAPDSTSESTQGTFIGGEPFVEGVPLTNNQLGAIGAGISMGNSYPPAVLNQYNEQTGANQ
jgi:hypothetical protein